jgi:hypothetical protein
MNWLVDFEDWIWNLGAQLDRQVGLRQALLLGCGLVTLFLSSVQSAKASDGILRFATAELRSSQASPPFSSQVSSQVLSQASPQILPQSRENSQRLLSAQVIDLALTESDRRIVDSINPAVQEVRTLRSQLQQSPATDAAIPNPRSDGDRDRNLNHASLSAEQLFSGGADSLVARTVGKAEGTRRADGGRNRAYYGHVDPGNRKWNLGSFSYQHAATSPEDADERQLRRLQRQDATLLQKAAEQGIELGLDERLNAIDLANQAPLAALDRGGYIERLKEAQERGFQGTEAILEARVNAYRHPDTHEWDAPGLGNHEASIRHDQARRMEAIAQVLEYDQTWMKKKGKFQANPPENRVAMQVDESWQR